MRKLQPVVEILKVFVHSLFAFTNEGEKSEKRTYRESLELTNWVRIIQVEIFWVGIFQGESTK